MTQSSERVWQGWASSQAGLRSKLGQLALGWGGGGRGSSAQKRVSLECGLGPPTGAAVSKHGRMVLLHEPACRRRSKTR